MYAKTPHLGKTGLTGFVSDSVRADMQKDLYEPEAVTVKKATILYIETHSGEYSPCECRSICDPYADGWAWHDKGRTMKTYKNNVKKMSAAEHRRLFELGFNDAKQYQEMKRCLKHGARNG